jgi:hypothetical protein
MVVLLAVDVVDVPVLVTVVDEIVVDEVVLLLAVDVVLVTVVSTRTTPIESRHSVCKAGPAGGVPV